MEHTHSSLIVRHLTYVFVSAATHFQAGGERKEAEDFELLCCVMKFVEYAKNKIVDKSFICLNVTVKLHSLSWDLIYICVYCTVIMFSTIKNKIPYSLLLNICPYMLEAVIYLKIVLSVFFNHVRVPLLLFPYYGQCIFLDCLIFCCHTVFFIQLFPAVINNYYTSACGLLNPMFCHSWNSVQFQCPLCDIVFPCRLQGHTAEYH